MFWFSLIFLLILYHHYIILSWVEENFFLLISSCYLWSSWRWMSKSLPSFGKFSAIISLKKLPLSPSLLLLELQEYIDCFSWWYLIVYAGFLCSSFLPSFHPSFFFSRLDNFKEPVFYLTLLVLDSVWCWCAQLHFFFNLFTVFLFLF